MKQQILATKENCLALLSRLTSKELTFGVRLQQYEIQATLIKLLDGIPEVIVDGYPNHLKLWTKYKVLGHPILIGDVLEKMGLNWAKKAVDEHLHNTGWILEKAQADLLNLWQPCGFTKSLQQIFSEAEWECICSMESVGHSPTCQMTPYGKVWPKQPHIKNLSQFLLQLFPA